MLMDFLVNVDLRRLLRKSHHRASLTPKLPCLFLERKPKDGQMRRRRAMDNYHSLIQALRTIGALIPLLEYTQMEISMIYILLI
jgi:hypothetical protein